MGEIKYLTHMTRDLNINSVFANRNRVNKTAFDRLCEIVESTRLNSSAYYIPGMRGVVCFTEIELGKRYGKKMDLVRFVQAKNKNKFTDNYYGLALPVEKNGKLDFIAGSDNDIHYKIEKVSYEKRDDIFKVIENSPSTVDDIPSEDRWMFKRDNYWVRKGSIDYQVSFAWEREWRKKGCLELKDKKFVVIVKTLLEKQYLRCLFATDDKNRFRVKPMAVISFEERVGINRGEYSLPNNNNTINMSNLGKLVKKIKDLGKHEELRAIAETPFQMIKIIGYGGSLVKTPSQESLDSIKYFEKFCKRE